MESVKMALLTENFEGMIKGPDSSPNAYLKDILQVEDDQIFLGREDNDKLSACLVEEDLAVVQSAGLFTPCVYSAEKFGEICAAHALNDVYVINGDAKVGLNLVGFPNCQNPSILGDILAGGANKVKEAGAVLVGGHTIQDDELKYGLCITGFANPKSMWKTTGAKEDDVLILTKAVGSGFIACAAMADMVLDSCMEEASASMATLNKYAVDVIRENGIQVHACTEISGEGLLGAVINMVLEDELSVEVYPDNIAVLKESQSYADMGLIPSLYYANLEKYKEYIEDSEYIGKTDCLFVPEISGGLLFAVSKDDLNIFENAFGKLNLPVKLSVVGEVKNNLKKKIYLKR